MAKALIPVVALVACLAAVCWQIAYAAHFSFLFASTAFALVSLHWLLEELDLVPRDPAHPTYEA